MALARKQTLLDPFAVAVLMLIGDGNIFLGAREEARRIQEYGGADPANLKITTAQ